MAWESGTFFTALPPLLPLSLCLFHSLPSFTRFLSNSLLSSLCFPITPPLSRSIPSVTSPFTYSSFPHLPIFQHLSPATPFSSTHLSLSDTNTHILLMFPPPAPPLIFPFSFHLFCLPLLLLPLSQSKVYSGVSPITNTVTHTHK